MSNSHQGIDGDVFLATLNPAYIDGGQAGFFRQLFLAESQATAMLANCFAENAPMLWQGMHCQSSVQKLKIAAI